MPLRNKLLRRTQHAMHYKIPTQKGTLETIGQAEDIKKMPYVDPDKKPEPIYIGANLFLMSPEMQIARFVAMTVCGYHGYIRGKDSWQSAITWSFFAAMFPFVTTGIALSQGYAKRSKEAKE